MESYLQSFKKFLVVNGHLSTNKSTTMSPKLVTISTDILDFPLCPQFVCVAAEKMRENSERQRERVREREQTHCRFIFFYICRFAIICFR